MPIEAFLRLNEELEERGRGSSKTLGMRRRVP